MKLQLYYFFIYLIVALYAKHKQDETTECSRLSQELESDYVMVDSPVKPLTFADSELLRSSAPDEPERQTDVLFSPEVLQSRSTPESVLPPSCPDVSLSVPAGGTQIPSPEMTTVSMDMSQSNPQLEAAMKLTADASCPTFPVINESSAPKNTSVSMKRTDTPSVTSSPTTCSQSESAIHPSTAGDHTESSPPASGMKPGKYQQISAQIKEEAGAETPGHDDAGSTLLPTNTSHQAEDGEDGVCGEPAAHDLTEPMDISDEAGQPNDENKVIFSAVHNPTDAETAENAPASEQTSGTDSGAHSDPRDAHP